MDYSKQKKFFANAYDLGEKRLTSNYGWPIDVDPQIIEFYQDIKNDFAHGKVLDLGCGQGRHALYFAEQGYEAWGVDYVERAINEAAHEAKKRNLHNVHFQVMDLLNLDFPKNTFDVIIDWSVLDHMYPTEWKIYLKNILNVLKVGGYLMLTEFSADDNRIKDKSKNFSFDRGSYDHYFRRDELESIFSKKFDIVQLLNTKLGTPPTPHIMINALLKRSI